LTHRWEEILEHLQEFGRLEPSHRYLGLAMLGKKRTELRDPVVMDWTLAYVGAIFGGAPTEPNVLWKQIGEDGIDTFQRAELNRLYDWYEEHVPDREMARQFFRDTAAEVIAELKERFELIALREQQDRKLTVRAAQQDTSAEGAAMLRFAESQDRRMRIGVNQVRALRAARLAESGQPVQGARASRAPRANGPVAPSAVAPEGVPANAPAVTTSVGRGSPTPPSAGPEVSPLGASPGLETCGHPKGGVGRPAPNEGVAPEEAPAVAPQVTTRVESTSEVEKPTSEANVDTVGRGSPTPPSAGPEVSADGLGAGLEACGLPEGGVMRPAPNEAQADVEKSTSEANEAQADVEESTSEAKLAAPVRVPPVSLGDAAPRCDQPALVPGLPHRPPPSAEPARNLNPCPPAERPAVAWDAYRPRDG
jgi:hypothetical protein